jgi:hypothetical protein
VRVTESKQATKVEKARYDQTIQALKGQYGARAGLIDGAVRIAKRLLGIESSAAGGDAHASDTSMVWQRLQKSPMRKDCSRKPRLTIVSLA